MRLEDLNNTTTAHFAFLVDVIRVSSFMVGIMLFVAGLITLKRYADKPQGSATLSQGLIYMAVSIAIMVLPQGLSNMNTSSLPDESISQSSATKTVESKPYVESARIEIKKTQPSKPLIAKSEPIKVPEKPVDYKQFFIAFCSVFGIILGIGLSVFGLMKLRNTLKLRKYQKIVTNVADLKNDFVTLSEHITTIDGCLNDIRQYRVSAPNKIKIVLDSMQNVLEHKKHMFNTAVKEIHDTQPELKIYGDLA